MFPYTFDAYVSYWCNTIYSPVEGLSYLDKKLDGSFTNRSNLLISDQPVASEFRRHPKQFHGTVSVQFQMIDHRNKAYGGPAACTLFSSHHTFLLDP